MLLKKLSIALFLSASCFQVNANVWVQDNIVVASKTTDAAGNTMPETMTYDFSYSDDELSAVHMVMQSGDAVRKYDVLTASHFFKYETVDGNKRLKAILLFDQGRFRLDNNQDFEQDFSFKNTVKNLFMQSMTKWILVVSERDALGRATVVNKYYVGSALTRSMSTNVNSGLEPLTNIEITNQNVGDPIGVFKITYKSQTAGADFQEVNTYKLDWSQCSTCPAPPVADPIPGYNYIPSIDYKWDYKSDGGFTTTFDYHVIDAVNDHITPFYQQEVNIEDFNSASNRPQRIEEYANNIYNLAPNSSPILLWEYTLNDTQLPSGAVDDYLFGLSMMGIGTQQENSTDISFGSILQGSGSGGSNGQGENPLLDGMISFLDKRYPGLGTVISQVASFGPGGAL